MEEKQQKQRGENSKNDLKRFSATIFLILMIMFTPILVFASEFDNIKGDLIIDDTTSKYGKIEIKDWFGLLDLATLELKENTDICGFDDCSMRTEIIMYQDGVLIDAVKFKQKDWDDTWHPTTIDYQFYIKTSGTEWQVDDYQTQCDVGKTTYLNGTNKPDCVEVKTGTHREDDYTWKEYELGTDVKEGTYYIKLEGIRTSPKWIDWIITSQGKELDFWYVWGEFIEGPVMNNGGGGTGLCSNGTIWLHWEFDTKVFHLYYQNYSVYQGGLTWTPSVWINPSIPTAGGCSWNGSHWFVGDSVSSANRGGLDPAIHIYNPDYTHYANITWVGNGTYSDFGMNDTNIWVYDGLNNNLTKLDYGGNHIKSFTIPLTTITGMKMNNSNIFIYDQLFPADPVLRKLDFGGNIISSFPLNNTNADNKGMTLYRDSFYFSAVDGVTRYYNAPYIPPVSVVTTTLNSPIDYYNSTSNSITFNCSAETNGIGGATLANVSLWLNITGTWVLNNTTTGSPAIWTLNIPEGKNLKWTCWANDSSGESAWATNRTFSVDIIYPIMTIINPLNITYNTNVTSLNYTYIETNPSRCWYSEDNGVINSSSSTFGTNWSILTSDEGSNTWTLYCNDTAGNENSTSITFFKDTTFPLISIVNPVNNTDSINNNLNVNYTFTETNPSKCWYSNDTMETNTTLASCGTNITDITWSEGKHNVTIWINDTLNNVNSSIVFFTIDTTYPIPTIVFPTNTTYATNVSTLNYTFTETNPSACWYSEDNGVTNSSNVVCGTNFSGLTSDEGSNTWTMWINDTAGNENSTSVSFYKDTIFPQINITYPTASNYSTNVSALNYTFSEAYPSYCWYSEDNGTTNSSFTTCGTNWTGLTSDEGWNTWTIWINDTLNNVNKSFVTFFKDTIYPIITINEPTGLGGFGYEGIIEELNWSIVDTNFESAWYNFNGTNISLIGKVNSTTFILEENSFNITLWAKDTSGNQQSTILQQSYKIWWNSNNYSNTTYETASETIIINVTANSSLTAANLIYAGTSYAGIQSGKNWSKTLDVPIGSANNNFYWNFTYAGNTITGLSKNRTQTANYTRFVQCNATYPTTYINYTFADEINSTAISAHFPLATFVYWLGSGTVNKTLTYINITDYNHFAFCVDPSHVSLNVNQDIQYDRTNYQQRIVSYKDLFTNTTTTRELLLLATATGQFVTYQVVNTAEQAVEDVFVNVTYSGTLIGSGYTDAAGAITFFLNPNFLHSLVFKKEGYEVYTLSHFPTQTSYTVSLGSGTSTSVNDYSQGISYATHPQNNTLTNGTAYDFKFILVSNYWTTTKFGFVLRNTTGSIVGGNSATTNGGTVTLNYNVGDNSNIFMDYYWVIAGNYTNITRSWYVLSASGTDWSIKTFFEDFNRYTSQEIFGLDNFGRNLIVFLIIFMFTGIMSYKFGLISPAAIMSIIFGLVYLFDVGFGMISLPIVEGSLLTPLIHFPTIIMGLILLGVLFREVYQ